ncbi:hypothetical protein [uncultured Thiodictyon sp.]|uniref:hypothetical protein n=1 Tax=uncultured Thiodictyon sp. TaxID=1846217 RepID=UPI0025D084AC|nr:hypothetical protein [uncultured Thiodictyon sp.]
MAQLRDLPGFGTFVDGLSWAIGNFNSPDRAYLIAIAILAAAMVCWVWLHFLGHRRWVRPIRRLSAELRKLRGSNSDATARLVQAGELFEQAPALAPLWRDYRKHLQPNPQAEGYLNLVDPRLWFSVESLPPRGYEQWCATWSGVFLTVGLLFTFIGLSAALLEVGGIAGADSAAMKGAINRILGVSSAKFITSIAGLVAYIGFSLVTRRYQSSQQAAARDLADAVQHFSLPLTPELLLYEQNDIARRQLTHMEHLTDDLAVAIDVKMEQRLKALAADFGQHLGTIQHDLPGATAKPIVDAIQNMSQTVAQEFSKQVQQTAGSEVNTVAERFTAVATELARIKDGMGGAGEAFGKDIRDAAIDLRDAAGKMGQGIDSRSKELAERISQFGGKLDSITSTLGQVPASIDQALNTTLDKLTDAVGTLVNRLTEGGESGASALSAGGEEAGNRLKASAAQAGIDLKERIDEVSGKLDGIAGALSQVPTNISGALNETMSKLTAAIDVLVSRLTAGGQSSASALSAGGEEAGNRLKVSAGQAGQDLQERIGAVSGKLDGIAGALGQVPGDISLALSGTLAKLTEAVGELTSRLAQGGRDGGDALRDGGQRAGEGIENAVGRAGNEFDRLVTQATGKLVEQFAAAQAGLQSAIQDLASRLQTVESSLKMLPGAVAAQVQNLDAAGQTFKVAGQTVTGASNALQQAAQPLLQTATSIRESMDQIRQGVVDAAAIHQQAAQSSQAALDGLKRAADAAEYTFKTHEDRFGKADVELAKALGTLRTGVEQVAKATQEVFSDYDKHITQAVNSLSVVVTDVAEVAEGLSDSLQQMADARQPPRRSS